MNNYYTSKSKPSKVNFEKLVFNVGEHVNVIKGQLLCVCGNWNPGGINSIM